jgi:formylmethanofuran dehydrogenase subunit E
VAVRWRLLYNALLESSTLAGTSPARGAPGEAAPGTTGDRMSDFPIELQEAARFHTHLGPYLVVGLRMGRVVTRELGSEPFSYRIRAHTGRVPPYSCSVDGMQLATPCTTGNGCIEVTNDRRMALVAVSDNAVLTVTLRREVFDSIERDCSEDDQDRFSLWIWEMPDDELFTISLEDAKR